MKRLRDTFYSSRISLYLVVVIVICFVLLFLSRCVKTNGGITAESVSLSEATSEKKEEYVSPATVYVDIKGAVKNPGMYEITQEMRVWDALMLAGGMKDEADTKQVNFAQRITDQMVIVVPKVGEESQQEGTLLEQSDHLEQGNVSEKVNINKASETELMTLSGIGQKKAQEIIRYREENGGFRSIEQLMEIAGVGAKTFEKLKESICTE